MCGVIALLLGGIQRFEINNDWLLRVAHDYPSRRCIGRRIDLLVRYKRRYIDKIAGLDLLLKLHLVAPAHLTMTRYNIDNRLNLAMVMNAAGSVWSDNRYAAPYLLRTSQFASNG